MELRCMQPADRPALLDLLERAFGVRELFERYLDFDPGLRPADTLLACEDGSPVACVQLFRRRIRLRREVVELGGIGSVATDEAWRGRSLATQLLRRAMDELRERGHPIGLLFTGRYGFYERLGWRQVSQRLFRLRRATAWQPPSGWELRPFAAGDLPEVHALYDSYTQGLSGCTVRDTAYWSGQLRFAGTPDERFVVAERDGRLAAYLRLGELEERCYALEYARGRGGAAALAALLLSETPAQRSLYAPIVPDPELGQALRAAGAAPAPAEDPRPMWCVLDRDRLAAIAGLPDTASDRSILDSLVGGPSAVFWAADRF
jgi:predicted N-acetyltransferase YhbS